jgi:hypothetical protein
MSCTHEKCAATFVRVKWAQAQPRNPATTNVPMTGSVICVNAATGKVDTWPGIDARNDAVAARISLRERASMLLTH